MTIIVLVGIYFILHTKLWRFEPYCYMLASKASVHDDPCEHLQLSIVWILLNGLNNNFCNAYIFKYLFSFFPWNSVWDANVSMIICIVWYIHIYQIYMFILYLFDIWNFIVAPRSKNKFHQVFDSRIYLPLYTYRVIIYTQACSYSLHTFQSWRFLLWLCILLSKLMMIDT